MHNFTMIRKNFYIHKIITFFVLISFIVFNIVFSKGFAQSAFSLTNLGAINAISSTFTPTMLRGIIVDPNNPFEFDFIIDPGDDNLTEEDFNQASEKLIRYFLASLTIPEDDLWVNLSPHEQDRIIPESFSHTEMGIDLLSQDYLLKQITASLLNPDDEIGKAFWDNVYKKAYKKYGTTSVVVDTFNKVWIMPDQAVIYENGDRMFIIESRLKVMLEQDYLAQQAHSLPDKIDSRVHEPRSKSQKLASSIMREVIVPELEREVNQGKNFSNLRQIYHSLILAAWFKETLKDSILNQVYSDQSKTRGLEAGDHQMPPSSLVDTIYAQYLQAYKKGVVDTIRVEYDPYIRQNIPRKYFSGGVHFSWDGVKERFERVGYDDDRVRDGKSFKLARTAMSASDIPANLQILAERSMQKYPPDLKDGCVLASDWIIETWEIDSSLRLAYDFLKTNIVLILPDGSKRNHTFVEISDGGRAWILDGQLKQFQRELGLEKEFIQKGVYEKKKYYDAIGKEFITRGGIGEYDFAMTVHNEYVDDRIFAEQLIKPFPEDQDFQKFTHRIRARKLRLDDLKDVVKSFEDYQRSGKEIPWLYLNFFADSRTFPANDQEFKEELINKFLLYKDALFQYVFFQEILNPEDFAAQPGTIINYFNHFQEEFDAQDLRKIAKKILESLAPAFHLTEQDISRILRRTVFLWTNNKDEIQETQEAADRYFVIDQKGSVLQIPKTLGQSQDVVKVSPGKETLAFKDIFFQAEEIIKKVLSTSKAKILSDFHPWREYSKNLIMLNGKQIDNMTDVFDRLTSELGHAIHFYLLDENRYRQFKICPVVAEIFDGLARRLRGVEYNWHPGLILYRLSRGRDLHSLKKWLSTEGGLEQIENKIYATAQDSDQVRLILEDPSMIEHQIALYILHKMSDLAGSDQRAAAVISVMFQDADEDALAWNRDFRIFIDHFKKVLNNDGDRINEILSKQYPLVKLDANEVGGIDFTSRSLEFKRQQDSSPVEIKVDNFENFGIDGLHPVVIHVAPIVNLPLLLGVVEEAQAQQLSSTH